MSWPIPSHFSKMLQNPQIAFRDPQLQACAIERDEHGQPRARAGAFANVYKGTLADRSNVALRVFTRAADERRERYAAISRYLMQHKLRSLVHFDYQEKGIRVADAGGKWFPLVTMEWVEGDILFDWVRAKCLQRDTRQIAAVAEKWVELVAELHQHRVAHGDLQHGNVMVTATGELKLVDYDCMCVPDLEGKRNLEIGVEPYQHPERTEETSLFAGLDNFSALYILVALRALAAAPGLWNTFNEPPNDELYDKLLFRKSDFDAPQRSALYQQLRSSPDTKVRKWSDDLFGLWRCGLKDLPPLAHFVNDFETVRQLLNQKSFDEALELLSRGRNGVPPDMQAAIGNAKARVECRQRLEEALRQGDEEALARQYDPRLLDDYAKAQPVVAAARRAAQVVPVLQQLRAARQAGEGRRLVQVWDSQQALLNGRQSAAAFQADVEQWRQRNQLCDTIREALTRDPALLAASWNRLQRLGGHPELATQRPAIERLLAQHEAFQRIQAISGDVNEPNDRALVAGWNEPLFKDWPVADRERPRVQAARQRLSLLQAVVATIQQHSAGLTLSGERGIAEAGAKLAADYEPAVQKRVRQARLRLLKFDELEKACRAIPCSESALAETWNALLAVGGEGLVPAPARERLGLAVRRSPVLAALKSISPSLPLDQRDRRILTVWDDSLLADCPEAEAWRPAWREAGEREKLLARLDAVLASESDAELAALVELPLLAAYPFPPAVAESIARSRKSLEETQRLLDALQAGPAARFVQCFDWRVIARHRAEFAPFAELILERLAEVRTREALGLKPPLIDQPLRIPPGGERVQLRWTWPQPRFAEKCILTLSREKPENSSSPESEGTLHKTVITRKAYESGGGYYQIHARPAWRGAYVAVWVCLEVGAETVLSEPLILGRVPTTENQTKSAEWK